MKLQEKQKKQAGITLVALVVTIIILIILATISIRMVIGEGGLIWQANNGKVEYRAAEVEEEVLAWKTEKKLAQYADEIQPMDRDAFIDDQASRGLLTPEEAGEAKEKGQVKIGSKVIDYGEDETTTEPEGTLEVTLTVDEAKATGTEIPVTVTVSGKDGEEVPEGLIYEFYKGEEKDGESSETDVHTFNGLDETQEYTLKVVVKDAEGKKVGENTVAVGVLDIACIGNSDHSRTRVFRRYTVGMTWDDFLNSEYSKELVDGYVLKKVKGHVDNASQLVNKRKYFDAVGSGESELSSLIVRAGVAVSPDGSYYYTAIPDGLCGKVNIVKAGDPSNSDPTVSEDSYTAKECWEMYYDQANYPSDQRMDYDPSVGHGGLEVNFGEGTL